MVDPRGGVLVSFFEGVCARKRERERECGGFGSHVPRFFGNVDLLAFSLIEFLSDKEIFRSNRMRLTLIYEILNYITSLGSRSSDNFVLSCFRAVF